VGTKDGASVGLAVTDALKLVVGVAKREGENKESEQK
jgi:hypothetical protein